jgi:hypothetical protein
VDVEYLKLHWKTTKVSVIAAHLRMEEPAIRRLAIRLKLGPRPARLPDEDVEEPSPQEISERAASVRAQWSPEERERRRVGQPRGRKRWTVPVIETGEIEAPSFARI